MSTKIERILILCKTYPSPSAGHAETSCVAGITEGGDMRRIFPVPFRLIQDAQQFKKWQWITARLEKATNDHRPESHRIFVDTIQCENKPIPTTDGWRARREWISKVPLFESFEQAETARIERGVTLALIRPRRVLGLDIKPVGNPHWTDSEKAKLLQEQNQGSLFEETEAKSIRLLKKLPYDFHYRYECDSGEGLAEYRHKIVDWEAGALFWNVHSAHAAEWERPFRAKMETSLPGEDLMFLMGTIHRFPDQWLIVSLIYPPKLQLASDHQQQLF